MIFTGAATVLESMSGERRADPVSEHKCPVTVAWSGVPRCALHGQTSLSRLLSLPQPWHVAAGTQSVFPCGWDGSLRGHPLGCDIPGCAESCFALSALRRTAGFPEAGSWVWSLHVSFCWAFVFSSEMNSAVQKELPLKLNLWYWFWTGSKRNSRFSVVHVQRESQTLVQASFYKETH